jgi:WD40 repeat protein
LEENVRNKSFIRFAVLIIFVGLSSSAFPARAQNFSAWSAPVNLNAITLSDGTPCPAVVNSASSDSHPAISKDGLSLFFASTRPGGLGEFDLWVTQRDTTDDCWQPPVNLGPVVNSAFRDFAPNLSTDGHWLFFHSNRTQPDAFGKLPCGGQDLYATHRQNKRDDFGWEAPINLGCTVNTSVDDAGPTFFEDDNTGILYLYFTRNNKANDPNSTFFDIYVSTCSADLDTCNTQGLWGPAVPVDTLNSPFRDTRTAIRRRDGLEMILSTGRPGSLGNEDLWVSTRATTQDQNWSAPEPINCDWLPTLPQYLDCLPHPPDVPNVNSSAFDGSPALSWDGAELYFSSERTGVPGFAGGRDLYVSKRMKLPD